MIIVFLFVHASQPEIELLYLREDYAQGRLPSTVPTSIFGSMT